MNQLLQDWVTRQAQLRPDATSIVWGGEKLSYGQLETESNKVAQVLRESGCRKGDRVCILMPKSPAAVISMIGILKAGCMHVPVDTSSPPARVSRILDACENRWIFAAGPVVLLLNELLADDPRRIQICVGWMESSKPIGAHFEPKFSRSELDGAPSGSVPQQCATEDGAHILFTSGSTGVPKGVVITHSNVIAFVSWGLKHFKIDDTDRLSGHTPFHFDLSTFDIFGTLAAGAELHLVPPDAVLLAPKLVSFIRDSALTQWFSVPSVLNYIAKFNALKYNDFPSLRRVLWCGEVLPTPALIYWMQRLPHVRFTNLYGPTEATIASSYYDVSACPEDPKAAIPIGRACDGEELLVLNDQFETVPPREIGNLYIAGVGLSPGYWRDSEKTAGAFLPDPHSGNSGRRLYRTGDLAWADDRGLVYFVGRADTQIKVRGYRIELGEVETALNSLEKLKESAVVAIQTENFGGWMICCAYAPKNSVEITPNDLRKDLERLIPSYMLPVRWMACEVLPKNANGKINRPLLRDLFLQNQLKGSELNREDTSGYDRHARTEAGSLVSKSIE